MKPCKKCGAENRLPPSKDKKTGPCRPCVYAKNTKRRKRLIAVDPEKVRNQERTKRYGLTDEQYRILLSRQDGKCAICLKVEKLEVDHCHTTNKIRGLLCGCCNRAIGLLKNNPTTATNAAAYLVG